MIRGVALSFIVFLGSITHAGFFPYNPGPGYLPPSYSYQQQPFQQQGYYQQQPYQQQGYQQQPFQQQPMAPQGSPLACTAISCSSWEGFRKCLADPSSPFRYFRYHPENLDNPKALTYLRKFIDTHPNCYKQFCNRVCSTVPDQFRGVPSIKGKKTSWLGRQKDWVQQNDRWRAREYDKRSSTQQTIEGICRGKGLQSREAKLLCSQCVGIIKGDREIIPACQQDLDFKGESKIAIRKRERPLPQANQPQYGNRSFSSPESREMWGLNFLKLRQGDINQEKKERYPTARREKSAVQLVMTDSNPTEEMEVEARVRNRNTVVARGQQQKVDQGKQVEKKKVGQGKQVREQGRNSESGSLLGDDEEDSSETASQISRSSQGSQRSSSSRSSQQSQLSAKTLSQLPQGKGQSVGQWAKDQEKTSQKRVSQSRQEEDAFSDDGSDDDFSDSSSDSGEDDDASSVGSDDEE